MRKRLIGLVLLLALLVGAEALAASREDVLLDSLVSNLTHPDAYVRERALGQIRELKDRAAVPALVELARFHGIFELDVFPVLEELTGEKLDRSWSAWAEFVQKHEEIKPNPGFLAWKSYLFSLIDPNFKTFLYPGVPHRTRIEEILWGGVAKDGIPALMNPKHVPAGEASYLTPDELVFGVSINGDHRAYPLRILDWHEMFNDVVGGKPVTLSY